MATQQMSDVLQLDYFTCASLLTEAREDFDMAEHKPVIRAIHAYYSSLEAILRAVFFLLRLRRDSVRGLCGCLLSAHAPLDAPFDRTTDICHSHVTVAAMPDHEPGGRPATQHRH
jgi:hypothetical protein